MKIYVATSWRNAQQPVIVQALRNEGHEVYDFRNPVAGDRGFHWSDVYHGWRHWTPESFRNALRHPVAERGFAHDLRAMEWADACVMVQPCGDSAHLEAGWFAGRRKLCIVLIASDSRPELMYKLGTHVCVNLDEVKNVLANWDNDLDLVEALYTNTTPT